MRFTTISSAPSAASLKARADRLAASDYAACKLAMRRARYYPATTGPGTSGRFSTTDRPLKCKADNAGRDVTYI